MVLLVLNKFVCHLVKCWEASCVHCSPSLVLLGKSGKSFTAATAAAGPINAFSCRKTSGNIAAETTTSTYEPLIQQYTT